MRIIKNDILKIKVGSIHFSFFLQDLLEFLYDIVYRMKHFDRYGIHSLEIKFHVDYILFAQNTFSLFIFI